MMYAAARQSPEIVDALLHFDARVNEEDSSGKTALHFAAGLASPTWNLLNPLADYPEPPTASFWHYLFLPAKPNPEVVAQLLAAGANPNAVDFEGATPLMYAAETETPEVLRALLAAGADPDAQDAEGRAALMYAADHCQTESVRLLVEAGADVALQDTNGRTALKRVQRKPSKFRRRMCRTDRKQIKDRQPSQTISRVPFLAWRRTHVVHNTRQLRTQRLFEIHVPAVYLAWANSMF